MALQYGMNITASDMKSLLEKNDKLQSGVRTWRQLFGNASLGYNAQSDALTTDYSDAIAKAYRANFEQNNTIIGAGLSTGITKELLSQSRNDLHTAYETYIRNYGKDIETASQNYAEEVSAIDAALTERAANFSNLYNSAYKYLSEELYGGSRSTAGTGSENINYIDEYGLDWVTQTDPKTEERRLLSWNELSHKLMNPDGSLTREGVMFFDQMFNATPQGYMTTDTQGNTWNTRSFDEWLSTQEDTFKNYDSTNLSGMAKNGRELRDWWISQDAFNYNLAGTNRGTSNVLSGRESIDDKYSTSEYPNTDGMDEFKFNSGEHGGEYSDALSKAKEKLDYAKTYYESAIESNQDQMIVASTGGGMPAVSDPNKYFPEARNAWISYQGSVKKLVNKLDTFSREKMGTEMFLRFKRENKALYDEYDALMEEARSYEYYDENMTNRIDKWYNNLYKQINSYIGKHGYTGKTSGF